MSSLENYINTSPFISGCVMLIMNLGGRYIVMEVPDGMNNFFSKPWVRKLTIMCVAFMATRNIKLSIILMLLFVLLSRFLMNENSKCCLIKINKEKK
jgi:hypothetical protein